jgi:pimeloyl-ACP methyl ester carboxylesterase
LGRQEKTVETIISPDGTAIAYQRSGAGSPLVLLHGTAGSSVRWAPILPALEAHFEVYAVDRRGRGASGDGAPYAIEREFEDIVAVVEAIGAPVAVLGHSFGGLCALEAALRTPNLRQLLLYEPALSLPGLRLVSEGVIGRLEELLGAGDREGVLTTFTREVVGMSPDDFARFRSSPAWPARLAAAHTLPRELRAQDAYRLDFGRLEALQAPTLLLLGDESLRFFKAGVEALSAALPNSQVAVLPGQRHVAMDTAPELFVRELLNFLKPADVLV